MRNKLSKFYTLKIERVFNSNWLNLIATIYLNFRCFPIKQAIRLPVFIYGFPRFYSLFGSMICVGKYRTGMIKINTTIAGGPSYTGGNTELNIWGKIIFRGKCIIGTGNKINIGSNGILDLGEYTKVTNYCNITAYSNVQIGSYSWIVHRCQILDSNFHFIVNFNKAQVKKIAHPITIGRYCWICNSTTITGGAIIPDKTIVASNSLVGKDFSSIPQESIIGGIPAKLISTGYRRVDNKKLIDEILKYFINNSNIEYYPLKENINHSICDADLID